MRPQDRTLEFDKKNKGLDRINEESNLGKVHLRKENGKLDKRKTIIYSFIHGTKLGLSFNRKERGTKPRGSLLS